MQFQSPSMMVLDSSNSHTVWRVLPLVVQRKSLPNTSPSVQMGFNTPEIRASLSGPSYRTRIFPRLPHVVSVTDQERIAQVGRSHDELRGMLIGAARQIRKFRHNPENAKTRFAPLTLKCVNGVAKRVVYRPSLPACFPLIFSGRYPQMFKKGPISGNDSAAQWQRQSPAVFKTYPLSFSRQPFPERV